MDQMKKLLLILPCLLTMLVFVSCAEEEPDDREVYFEADLTFDVLEEILLEKGDGLLATDIPEKYMYVFDPVGIVPQIRYPITEDISFSILPISDGENMLILTVNTDGAGTDYVGAEEILAYIAAEKH